MSQVYSDVLGKFVEEGQKDQLEAYHNRMTQATPQEQQMQQGAQNYSNQGEQVPQTAWSKLRSLMGSR